MNGFVSVHGSLLFKTEGCRQLGGLFCFHKGLIEITISNSGVNFHLECERPQGATHKSINH